jgi:hypothetical protein
VFPELKRIEFNRWEGLDARLRDPERLHKLFGIMEATLKRGGKVWVIDRAHSIQTRDPDDESEMKTLQLQAADLKRQDQIRTWLALHADTGSTTLLAPGRDFGVYLSVYKPATAPKLVPDFNASPAAPMDQPGSIEPPDTHLR